MAANYDFNLTRNQIINRAYRIASVLADGETMSGQLLNNGIDALNSMVKSWQQDKIFLWTRVEISRLLAIGVTKYDLSANDIVSIDKAVLRDSPYDYELELISYKEYLDIPDKSITGFPSHIASDNSLGGPNIYFWPVPDDNYKAYIHVIKKLSDFDDADGNADFPVRWIEALTFNLAYKFTFEYPLPINDRRLLRDEASVLRLEAMKGNREQTSCEFVRSAY